MTVSNKFKYALFASDTNILYSNKDFKIIQSTVNKELDSVEMNHLNLTIINLMVFSKSNNFVVPR